MKMWPQTPRAAAALLTLILGVGAAPVVMAAGDSAQTIYMRALGRERELRDASGTATLA